MEEVRISSWNDLQEALFHDSWDPQLERFRSRWVFRGLSNADYDLVTTLMRLGGPYQELERHLLRNFRKYAHRSMVERDSIWHWLSLAKHHGLPSRLLDWTYSPLVAMHFATANLDHFQRDSVIWAVNYHHAHSLLPARLREVLENEGAHSFTVDLLSRCLPGLDDLGGPDGPGSLLFMEPPSIDDRIVNQFALFSVTSDPALRLVPWFKVHPGMARRILIPASLKWEIRDKLDQANITERVLFPGLDGLSLWLKRQYSPKNPAAPTPG
ncbi:MAG: FRG domain-containing protein [Puniceicoccaceae bacterium]|nr:MAG: FRG domain-containing protein [Puniceicoccaceae bacterium]